ncbi:MAG: ATP-binding protein [Bacillota bacterium]
MREITADEARAVCRAEDLGCVHTDDLKPLETIIGQERAVQALEFGLGIRAEGFNVFVAGPPGTGKNTAVKAFLEEVARGKAVPPDWCYVHNFRDPYRPRALKLPAGMGTELSRDMRNLVRTARREIPRAFATEEYAKKKEEMMAAFDARKNELLRELQARAQAAGFVIQGAPGGIFIIPVIDGEIVKEKDFARLPSEQRQAILERREALEQEVARTFRELNNLEHEAAEALQRLDGEVAAFAVGHLFAHLLEKYGSLPDVRAYLETVREDMLQNIGLFRGEGRGGNDLPVPPWARETPFRRYEVNVLVDNGELRGAPVVLELNPTYGDLFGKIEKEAQFGTLVTDFTMIRGGSLHRANGGYIVIPVEEILRNLFAWDGLKRALRDREINIEEPGERLGITAAKSLRPEPVPLDVKVILLGEPLYYFLLYLFDPDFRELFKVKAEFGTRMDRTPDNLRRYAAFFCTLCEKENLLHLDASAVAKLVEYGSRLAEDQRKLATRFAEIADVVREACYYAQQEGAKYTTAAHVKRAIDARFYRSNLIQEHIQEMFTRNTLLLDVTGGRVGQVNGLSVLSVGDLDFGKPSRITASVAPGKDGVIDIEREARLGGRIHTKGVMILSGYLAEKYAREIPLSLSARLVFEQSYEGVEGDSASCAELFALLSALADVPVKQNLAVTGSINQKGEIQPVGGINEKIEGFFDVCRVKGFTGDQGVVIPAANAENLMLREDVVEAIGEGRFHVYLINTVDEGIELLTGLPAGERGPDGAFPEGSFNARVVARLAEFGERLREMTEEQPPGQDAWGDEEHDGEEHGEDAGDPEEG